MFRNSFYFDRDDPLIQCHVNLASQTSFPQDMCQPLPKAKYIAIVT